MNNKFYIHIVVLMLIQLFILNNIQVNPYVIVNIYILAIFILPLNIYKAILPIIGFVLGFIIDLSIGTLGINAAAATFIAFLRPQLIKLSINQPSINESELKKFNNSLSFLKYILISILIFNIIFVFIEVFSFENILNSILRIILSSATDIVLISIYYFIALKSNNNKL